MDAIALLCQSSSPPYSIYFSSSSVNSSVRSVPSEIGDGSINTNHVIVALSGFSVLIVLLVFVGTKCYRLKKYNKAVPTDLGVVNSDEHENNQNATPTDRVELRIDEHVEKKSSLVTGSDQLNKNNEKTATSLDIGVYKLNIDKHGKTFLVAPTLNIRVDQLNINKRGKNFLEAEATTSDVGVDKLNINKRGKNDKNKAEASTSYVKVHRLNINKCDKNHKKEVEATTSNVRVDQLNIDKHDKNSKKEAEATTSNIRVDKLNINKHVKNDIKEARVTTSDVRVDKLNIDKHVKNDQKETGATTSDINVRADQLNIDKHVNNDKKEAGATTSDIRVNQLNINKSGKNDARVDKLNIDKHDKNDKKKANTSSSNVRVDQLNIDECDKNNKKEAKTTTSDVKVDQLNIDKRDKNVKKETEATTSKVRLDKLNIDMRVKNDRKETKTIDSDFRVNKLNIEEHDKNTNKKKAKATTPSDVKYNKNDKKEATISDVEFDEDKLNINVHEKKKLKKGHLEKVAKLIHKVDEQKPRRYTAEDLKATTENKENRVGAGTFGDVYKGKSPDGVDIAVKVLKNWGNSNTRKDTEKLAAEQFMAEVESIYNTHHINVIRLLGFCYEDEKVDNSNPMIALVFEYMENGSLDKYLSGKKVELKFEKLYDIAIGTAKGLAYLHEDCPKKMVHFDIKPANILLDSKFTPKVCDFGLAKLCNRDDTHFSVAPDQLGGTFGYIAPEVIASNRRLTNKCDVYSFGIVLFKMVEVKRQNKNNNNNKSLSDWFPVCVRDAASINKLEWLIGRDCDFSGEHKDKAIRACKVGLLCIQQLPSSRPLMSQVVRMLEGADPINLPQSWPFQDLKPLPTRK